MLIVDKDSDACSVDRVPIIGLKELQIACEGEIFIVSIVAEDLAKGEILMDGAGGLGAKHFCQPFALAEHVFDAVNGQAVECVIRYPVAITVGNMREHQWCAGADEVARVSISYLEILQLVDPVAHLVKPVLDHRRLASVGWCR